MDEESREPGRLVTLLGVTSLLVLAFGGYVKGSDLLAWVPVDITVFGALGVAVFVVHSLLSSPAPMRNGYALFALLVASTGGLIAQGFAGNDYARTKPFFVFVVAPLCVVGGGYLLRSPRSRVYFAAGAVLIGALALALTLADPAAVDVGDRVAAEGSSTIGTGRAIGAAATVLAVAGLTSRRRWPLLIIAAVAVVGAVGVASRGPLVAAAAALAIALIFRSRRGRLVRVAAVAAGGWLLVRIMLSGGSVSARLTTLNDTSAETRRVLWRLTGDLIKGNPTGIGWGRLYEYVGPIANSGGWVQYPHNVLIEVTSEAGWAAGIMLAIVLAVSVRRQLRRMAAGPVEVAMLALLLYALVNAMVSGDVGSNRGLWVAIGAALSVGMSSAGQPDVLKDGDDVVQAGLERVNVRGG